MQLNIDFPEVLQAESIPAYDSSHISTPRRWLLTSTDPGNTNLLTPLFRANVPPIRSVVVFQAAWRLHCPRIRLSSWFGDIH